MEFLERIKKVQSLLKEHGLDAFLFSSQANVFYLSGFRSSHAYVVITQSSYHLLTDGRYYQKALQELKGWDIRLIKGKAVKHIKALLKELGVRLAGYEEDRVSCEFRRALSSKNIRWKAYSGFIKKLRAVKSQEEINIMKEGVKKSDEVYRRILSKIREGMRELELRRLIVEEFFKEGASGESFPAIVASGPASSVPHWESSHQPIKGGSPLLIDMGMVWKGYCTDFTRTLFVGRADPEFKKVYQVVKDAHLFALEKARVGNTVGDVDRAAREYIKSKRLGKYFSHSTGHGVGIEIHEHPRVYYKGQDKDIPIEEGMVFTIEPGVYIPGKFGVRLENIVVIKGGVGEPLSEVGLDLIEL
ncbi:MAG: aminopeptidase P family protein [Aquificota bacterium]|nr:MAG: aminopeptidase P family protein [Aquificota bacterium]